MDCPGDRTVPVAAAQVMEALRFLRAAREDPGLQRELAGLVPEDGLAPVVRLALAAGFTVTAESLRAAHGHDWGFRFALYSTGANLRPSTDDRDATTVAVVNNDASSV